MNLALRIDGFSYRYPGSREWALRELDVSVERGEFVLVSGESGSGKSTFLRAVSGLVPHHFGGEALGEVRICGMDLRETRAGELASVVGTLFQDPEAQSVMDIVRAELAFPLENFGWEAARIEAKVNETAELLGIAHLLERRTDELSGGELQRVVMAAALAPGPEVLVLDEPTSQLDPEAVDQLLATLTNLAVGSNTTILLADHRVEQIRPHVDRTIQLDKESRKSTPDTTGFLSKSLRKPVQGGGLALGFDGVHYCYPRGADDVLAGVDLSLAAGERAVLLGRNGSGKSTLLQIAKGLREPTSGRVTSEGEVALLMQNPNDYLIHERVGDEAPIDALRRFGVDELAERDPRDLSGGQRQRVALAIVMQQRPALLMLDEPSRGMSANDKHALAELLISISAEGTAVLVATHDSQFAELFAERTVQLQDGHVSEVATATDRVLEGSAA